MAVSNAARTMAALVGYHVATPARPNPPLRWHVARRYYVLAANGIFVQAATPAVAVCLQVGRLKRPIPGLRALRPDVRWNYPVTRLPGRWALPILLRSASALGQCEGHWTLAGDQHGLTLYDSAYADDRSSAHVRYRESVPGTILLRMHSHHAGPAFWSSTDDQDDSDVGVRAVCGTIFDRPTLRTRLIAWGHQHEVPARQIFDDLGPFEEGREWIDSRQ